MSWTRERDDDKCDYECDIATSCCCEILEEKIPFWISVPNTRHEINCCVREQYILYNTYIKDNILYYILEKNR